MQKQTLSDRTEKGRYMERTIAIGHQNFETVRKNNYFYIDKTEFIREWWNSGDIVTLITRPRRFGKTLNMSMTEQFFSVEYKDRGDIFEGLSIWEKEEAEKFRSIQGTCPVIALSFAGIKENTFSQARENICRIIEGLYNKYDFLLKSELLNAKEKRFYESVCSTMNDSIAAVSLQALSDYLNRYYEKKVIILLDEYDTPMQEAYVNGYWKELTGFTRSLFNSTFKTNPYLERALMTGITRVSRESVFSDLNNLKVITTTSEMYEDKFGFTEEEVLEALAEYHISEKKEEVKKWYDGFIFGKQKDMYNPWSIINYLKEKRADTYWANTSSNQLAARLLREGSTDLKEAFEGLLNGGSVETEIDEQIVYDQLGADQNAIWSLFLASGYLKVKNLETKSKYDQWRKIYHLELTNFEVKLMFRSMIKNWFTVSASNYNEFVRALLQDDVEAMNVYMNRVAMNTFSYFDTSVGHGQEEPERFYHGFVLGLMVELADRYRLVSNRESGFGRYDVMLIPRVKESDGIILEFKVFNPRREKSLEETVQNALDQIETKKYAQELLQQGIPEAQIRRYGFAFQGKTVLIGKEIDK